MRHLGRYAMFGELASGGMASVHLGRLLGPAGFARTVVIKRMRRELTKDPEFAAMFVDEACLAARVKHPNVVSTLDVVSDEDELFIVMDYVHGESLEQLMLDTSARGETIPLSIVSAILVHALLGLHAAHEAVSAEGEPLHLVHRDFSPHNVLVDVDGIARVADFGVAKTAQKIHQTRDGQIKGKWSYMSPEQVASADLDRRSDVFAAGIVLWEALTLERLFLHKNPAKIAAEITFKEVAAPSAHGARSTPELDAVALKALAKEPEDRFPSARAMADALRRALAPADTLAVSEWLESIAGERLAERARRVASVERASAGVAAMPQAAAKSHIDSERDPVPETPALSTLAAGSRLVDSIQPILAAARAERDRSTAPPEIEGAPPTTRRISQEALAPSSPTGGKATLAREIAANTVLADDAPDAIAMAREIAVSSRPGLAEAPTEPQPEPAPTDSDRAVVPPPRPRWPLVVVLLLLFAAALVVAYALMKPAEVAPRREETPRPSATAPAGPPSAPPARTSAAPPASTPSVRASATPQPPRSAQPAPRKPSCDPNFIVRPDGVKVFKPECFGP
jgi:eukaryotic-like serine/threonine-protein kinase